MYIKHLIPTSIIVRIGVFVLAGQDVTIPCDPTKRDLHLVDPTFIWKDGEGRPITHGRAEVHDNGALVISDAQPEDSGKYTCQVANKSSTVDVIMKPRHVLGLYRHYGVELDGFFSSKHSTVEIYPIKITLSCQCYSIFQPR